mmetsp:Transcript_3964/g.10384  ORF Transcript_3964/g.10384 Transcript_3964/m.10384 type:complete len:493 (-) Transcript_3964:77-1555(-)
MCQNPVRQAVVYVDDVPGLVDVNGFIFIIILIILIISVADDFEFVVVLGALAEVLVVVSKFFSRLDVPAREEREAEAPDLAARGLLGVAFLDLEGLYPEEFIVALASRSGLQGRVVARIVEYRPRVEVHADVIVVDVVDGRVGPHEGVAGPIVGRVAPIVQVLDERPVRSEGRGVHDRLGGGIGEVDGLVDQVGELPLGQQFLKFPDHIAVDPVLVGSGGVVFLVFFLLDIVKGHVQLYCLFGQHLVQIGLLVAHPQLESFGGRVVPRKGRRAGRIPQHGVGGDEGRRVERPPDLRIPPDLVRDLHPARRLPQVVLSVVVVVVVSPRLLLPLRANQLLVARRGLRSEDGVVVGLVEEGVGFLGRDLGVRPPLRRSVDPELVAEVRATVKPQEDFRHVFLVSDERPVVIRPHGIGFGRGVVREVLLPRRGRRRRRILGASWRGGVAGNDALDGHGIREEVSVDDRWGGRSDEQQRESSRRDRCHVLCRRRADC